MTIEDLIKKTKEEIEERRLESLNMDGEAYAEERGYISALRDMCDKLEAVMNNEPSSPSHSGPAF